LAQFVQCPQVLDTRVAAMDIIELATPGAALRIVPELGGSIASFTVGGTPILRPTPAAVLAGRDVRGTACYPLVPYSNRIRDAQLDFGGRRYTLVRNFGASPHAIHGVGWQRAWSVTEASRGRARLVLEHDARGANAQAWPWAFQATQTFHLADAPSAAIACATVLVATLTLANTGDAPFPFGLGFHPFFAKDAATRLGLHARRVWRNDAAQLPQALAAIPPQWRFDPPHALDAIALDNVFTGWTGNATIVDDAKRSTTRIDADRALAFAVVYAPPDGDFVAVEPVTHEADAFNRSAAGARGTGTRILPPGASFSCTMRIAAAPVARGACTHATQ